MKARALLFTGPRRVEIADVSLRPTGGDEVLVRTLYSGISAGTELLAYRGQVDPSLPLDETIGALHGTFSYPFPYGYSCTGEVVQAGGGLAAGAAVFVFHPHQDWLVAPARDVVAIDGVPLRQATLFPLVETAFQITLDAAAPPGEHVVVTGLGTVGILSAILLERAGAQVLAAEPREWRRKVTSSLGIEAVAPEELSDRVRRATGGKGARVLVEVSGDPAALASGLSLLAHEGTALVASWYGTNDAVLPLGADFHRRRLSIRSTQVSTIPARLSPQWTLGRRRQAVRALLPDLPLAELATHDFPFTAAGDAYRAVDSGEEGLVHAALAYAE